MRKFWSPLRMWTLCIVLLWCAATVRGQDESLFERSVGALSVTDVSRIDALFLLAKQQKLPLGIEYTGPQLFERASLKWGPTNLRDILDKLFPEEEGFRVYSSDGVLVIGHSDLPHVSSNVLDMKLTHLSVPATTLQKASSLLWMTLAMQINPDIKGFAGSIIGQQTRLVAPMELDQLTFRQGLSRLVRESGEAAWVIQVKPEWLDRKSQRGYNAIWMIAEYDNIRGSFGQLLQQSVNANSR